MSINFPQKPHNLKYTDLCIYIDKVNYYRDDDNNPIGLKELSAEEENTVFYYLCNLCLALASKKHLLQKEVDYQDFVLFAAGNLYMRLRRKDQDYTYQDKTIKPIKSILNFIKGSLAFMCISWREKNFTQTLSEDCMDSEELMEVANTIKEAAARQYTEKRSEAYREALGNLPDYIKKSLKESIYKEGSLRWYVMYMSCCLSLCNVFTLPSKFYGKKTAEVLLRTQLQNRDDYIITLSKLITKEEVALQIKKALNLLYLDIEEIDTTLTPTESQLGDILETAWPTYGERDED